MRITQKNLVRTCRVVWEGENRGREYWLHACTSYHGIHLLLMGEDPRRRSEAASRSTEMVALLGEAARRMASSEKLKPQHLRALREIGVETP